MSALRDTLKRAASAVQTLAGARLRFVGTPPKGTFWLYQKASDGKVYAKKDTGAEVSLEATAGGGSGTPAVSVTDETTYGITPAVGASTNYARQDHTHGSPTAPTAASVGADATGTAAAAVATHVGLADPHTQYALESALGTAAPANIGADLEETAGEVCASDDHRLWGPGFGAYRNAEVHANVGTPAPSAYGTTLTTRGTSSADATDATGAMESRTTAATANQSAGWWIGGSTPILTARQLAPSFLAVIVTPADITLYRICVGFGSTESAGDNPANHHAELAYSTVRGDGGWVILTKDGTTQTVSGTVLAIAAATRYEIRASLSAAGVFSGTINGTAFSASATPPGATNALGIIAQCQCTTTAARSITIGRVAVRSL